MSLVNVGHPWIFGRLAVYAPNVYVAREVYQLVISHERRRAFGTVRLNSGDEIDWIDMRFDVVPQDLEYVSHKDMSFLS